MSIDAALPPFEGAITIIPIGGPNSDLGLGEPEVKACRDALRPVGFGRFGVFSLGKSPIAKASGQQTPRAASMKQEAAWETGHLGPSGPRASQYTSGRGGSGGNGPDQPVAEAA